MVLPRSTLSILSIGLVLLPAGLAVAGTIYRDPGWDLVYQGDNDTYGTTFDTLDGNWQRDQASQWDGSAPGQFGDPNVDRDSASPGGVVALSENGTDYLRIQDAGNPAGYDPNPLDDSDGIINWNDPSNRKIYFGHNVEDEHPGVSSVLSNGLTISFRARLSSTGILDDVYPDLFDNEFEIPDLDEVTPWPEGGKGYNIKDDGRGMFTVQENGTNAVGFALARSFDTPAPNVGGGLIMNNRPPGGVFGLPGTDRAINTPLGDFSVNANVFPISDAKLTDWQEFWITLQDSGMDDDLGRDVYAVDVYHNGALSPASFLAKSSNGTEFPGQFIAFGLSSETSFGAVDIDFFAYRLGAVAPRRVPEPATATMAWLAVVSLLLVASRRSR